MHLKSRPGLPTWVRRESDEGEVGQLRRKGRPSYRVQERPVEVLQDSQVKGPWKLTPKELQMVLPGPHRRPGARGAEGLCSASMSP